MARLWKGRSGFGIGVAMLERGAVLMKWNSFQWSSSVATAWQIERMRMKYSDGALIFPICLYASPMRINIDPHGFAANESALRAALDRTCWPCPTDEVKFDLPQAETEHGR
jgi:hypothetical protein